MRTFPVIFEDSQRSISGETTVSANTLSDAIKKANDIAATLGTFLDYEATSAIYGFDVSRF